MWLYHALCLFMKNFGCKRVLIIFIFDNGIISKTLPNNLLSLYTSLSQLNKYAYNYSLEEKILFPSQIKINNLCSAVLSEYPVALFLKMMRNFCKAHTFSRSLFSTYRSEGKCQERRRISEFLKDVYLQNISNVAHILQKSDLKFANLVAYNASQLGIEDEGFKTLIASRISEELENLTPDLAFELVLNLRDLVAFDNPDIYETIYNYCQTYYYLFDQKQLEIIEKVFYSMGGGKFSFSENVFHEERHFSAKAKTKYETREQTKSVLDLYGINVPHDELEVVVRPYKKVIEIKFKKAQKTLTLAGIMHEDWGAVAKVKDLINQNDFDFYLMELGPITHSDTIKNKKAERKNNSKSKSNKEFIIDKFLNEYSQSTDQENKARRSSYLEYFDKYDRMALLDAPLLKWYTDTILHNSDVYQIMDAERVVGYIFYNR